MTVVMIDILIFRMSDLPQPSWLLFLASTIPLACFCIHYRFLSCLSAFACVPLSFPSQ
ncbi:hypothetical protein SynA15127_00605 [Synechococcus sp. A15-127]|nr:hypothetical protein SynA15127_00605 [Synechococcus sp. A15-127]